MKIAPPKERNMERCAEVRELWRAHRATSSRATIMKGGSDGDSRRNTQRRRRQPKAAPPPPPEV